MSLDRSHPRQLKAYLMELNKLTKDDMAEFLRLLENFHKKLEIEWESKAQSEKYGSEKFISSAEEMQSGSHLVSQHQEETIKPKKKVAVTSNTVLINEVLNKAKFGEVPLIDFIKCFLNARKEAEANVSAETTITDAWAEYLKSMKIDKNILNAKTVAVFDILTDLLSEKAATYLVPQEDNEDIKNFRRFISMETTVILRDQYMLMEFELQGKLKAIEELNKLADQGKKLSGELKEIMKKKNEAVIEGREQDKIKLEEEYKKKEKAWSALSEEVMRLKTKVREDQAKLEEEINKVRETLSPQIKQATKKGEQARSGIFGSLKGITRSFSTKSGLSDLFRSGGGSSSVSSSKSKPSLEQSLGSSESMESPSSIKTEPSPTLAKSVPSSPEIKTENTKVVPKAESSTRKGTLQRTLSRSMQLIQKTLTPEPSRHTKKDTDKKPKKPTK